MWRQAAFIASAAFFIAVACAFGGQPTANPGYPVPHDENQVFFVQRSMNSNTIVYAARIDADGQLDARKPVDVYWRRFNDDGARKELSALERNMAFGVRAEQVAGKPGTFKVVVVSYPQRSAILRMVDGKPLLEALIAGKPSRLDHAYLHLDEGGSMPRITQVDLSGYSLADGADVEESFKP